METILSQETNRFTNSSYEQIPKIPPAIWQSNPFHANTTNGDKGAQYNNYLGFLVK